MVSRRDIGKTSNSEAGRLISQEFSAVTDSPSQNVISHTERIKEGFTSIGRTKETEKRIQMFGFLIAIIKEYHGRRPIKVNQDKTERTTILYVDGHRSKQW